MLFRTHEHSTGWLRLQFFAQVKVASRNHPKGHGRPWKPTSEGVCACCHKRETGEPRNRVWDCWSQTCYFKTILFRGIFFIRRRQLGKLRGRTSPPHDHTTPSTLLPNSLLPTSSSPSTMKLFFYQIVAFAALFAVSARCVSFVVFPESRNAV